jgi:hypothetical protein
MLVDPAPFGSEMVTVKLKFEKAGEVSTEFHVGRLGGSGPPGAPSAAHKN